MVYRPSTKEGPKFLNNSTPQVATEKAQVKVVTKSFLQKLQEDPIKTFFETRAEAYSKVQNGIANTTESILKKLKEAEKVLHERYSKMAKEDPEKAYWEIKKNVMSLPWAKDLLKEAINNPKISARFILDNVIQLQEEIPNIEAAITAAAKKSPYIAIRQSEFFQELFNNSTDPVFVKLRETIKYFNVQDTEYRSGESPETSQEALALFKACAYLPEILNGSMTIEQAAQSSKDPINYLRKIIYIPNKEEFYQPGEFADELQSTLSKLTQHKEKLQDLTIEELITIINETHTSELTILNTFTKKSAELDKEKALALITSKPNSMYLLEGLANAGLLGKYLERFSEDEKLTITLNLIHEIATGKETYDLASILCDQFPYIQNTESLSKIATKLEDEYKIAGEKNQKALKLCAMIFKKISKFQNPWLNEMDTNEQVPDFGPISIDSKELFNDQNEHIQVTYFYEQGDGDGENSFKHFLQEFGVGVKYVKGSMIPTKEDGKDDWKILDKGSYIIAKKELNGKTLKIYANKPNRETQGKAAIKAALKDKRIHTVIHRGHVGSAYQTTEEVKPDTTITYFGSCTGDYDAQMAKEKAPKTSVINSTGTGTMNVNDILIKYMAERILKDQKIDWPEFSQAAAKATAEYQSAFSVYTLPYDAHNKPSSIFWKLIQNTN